MKPIEKYTIIIATLIIIIGFSIVAILASQYEYSKGTPDLSGLLEVL